MGLRRSSALPWRLSHRSADFSPLQRGMVEPLWDSVTRFEGIALRRHECRAPIAPRLRNRGLAQGGQQKNEKSGLKGTEYHFGVAMTCYKAGMKSEPV